MADLVTIIVSLILLYFTLSLLFSSSTTQRQEVSDEQRNQEIQGLVEMFPQIDRNLILRDFQQTGSLTQTTENILSGRIPARVPVPQQQSSSKPAKSGVKNVNYIPKKPVQMPEKEWSGDPSKRQETLLSQKEFMMQEARSRYKSKNKI